MLETKNNENRECKNSVFVDLFFEDESSAENDISLYNALHDQPLPKPEFYVFYNGKEKWIKEKVQRLSDAYIVQEGEANLELMVKVININPDQNHEILEKCRVLKEYSMFIDTIRRHQERNADNAYEKAIRECIEKGILADYLRKHGSEVVNMLVSEYNYEQDIEVQREEAFDEGLAKGLAKGRAQERNFLTALIEKLLRDGRSEELIKITRDEELLEKLYREYNIK